MQFKYSQNCTKTRLRSFLYRKHFEILTVVFVITLACVLLSSQFQKTIHNINVISVNYETTLNISEHSSEKFETEYEIELPLKTKLKTILNCRDITLHMEKLQYGQYWLMKNYIRGRLSINMGCAESITYTTHGDYTFMGNLPTVVERWLAPVSFAIFAPGYDYNATMDSISYVLNCLPLSELIRDYVTFHIYFPKDHMPSFIAKNEEEALEWPYDCQLPEPPYTNVNHTEMYKTKQNMTYPINVGRNIARKAATTYFILASDIELYPSLNLVDSFLNLVYRNSSAILEGEKPKVFPMPIFEVAKNAYLPDTKKELIQMLDTNMAIPFHYHVCSNCHLVPKQVDWLEAANSQEMEIITVGKRYDDFKTWEPFYISNNKEPGFDERVTWEGQSNKRIQNYAMCLLDYEYHILHPAFLVHSPGIKKFNPKAEESKVRLKYAAAMNKIIRKEILPEYSVLYGINKRCKV